MTRTREKRSFARSNLILSAAVVAVAAVAAVITAINVNSSSAEYQFGKFDIGSIATYVNASGELAPIFTVDLSSQISGQISELYVDFNDVVTRGMPLARLDPRSFLERVRESQAELDMARAGVATAESAVSRATADLDQARAEAVVARENTANREAEFEFARMKYERAKDLTKRKVIAANEADKATYQYQSGRALLAAAKAEELAQNARIEAMDSGLSISLSNLDNAKATERFMEAKLELAKIELDRTTIRAPIDGIIIRRNVKLGQTVAASLSAPNLFTIAQDLQRMKIEANVDEADIGYIKAGQNAKFTVDAFVGRSFGGQVSEIRLAPEVFQNVVTYIVIIDVDNFDLALRPGMTANVEIVVGEASGVLRVPNSALRYEPDGRDYGEVVENGVRQGRVWLPVEDGTPRSVALQLGISNSTHTEVRNGPVRQGDTVIIGQRQDRDSGWLE